MFRVEVARVPEQADLVAALQESGFAARPSGDVGVEVACEDCQELLRRLDAWIAERDLPLVPIRAGDTILLHPPSD
jgi:hypothetical protein